MPLPLDVTPVPASPAHLPGSPTPLPAVRTESTSDQEINDRRAQVENPEGLRLARAL